MYANTLISGEELVKVKQSVTVVIPTRNEEEAIGLVLKDISRNVVDEVIIVDSSEDGTLDIIRATEAKVIRELREGYGRALQTGVENASSDVIVYIDGDYTYDSKEIFDVVKPVLEDKCDVVLGSRFRGKMLPGSMSWPNKLGNLILSFVFNVLFFKKVSDTQSGLRAIRKELLKGLSYRDYGMAYVTEQMIKLVKRSARTGEVPVTYRRRIGKTKLRWSDGFRILKTIIRGRFE